MAETRHYKFLLAVDGSANAQRAAEYLVHRAATLGPCEVHVVNVQPAHMAGQPPAGNLLLPAAGVASAGVCRALDGAGISWKLHGELGDPAERIAARARADGCDEIVAGSRGMSMLDHLLLGSVAYKLVHLSPVPVTVVPNPYRARGLDLEDGGDVHRILLAVDGSESSARAVDYVCGASRSRVPVHVELVNVQVPIGSGNVRRFVSQETIDAWHREESEVAMEAARRVLKLAGVEFSARMLVGSPAQVIVKAAQDAGCTRIVMGTRGSGALAGAVVGSTALRVLHLSEIPVTLVK